jgi:hypothetical protein
MPNISEFERTKPTLTLKKINALIEKINDEKQKTEILYKDRMESLEKIVRMLDEMKQSFLKGE